MKHEIKVDSSGLLFTLLTVLFVGLKLTGHIDWSWWWVLAPLWGPAALGIAVFVLVFAVPLAAAGALSLWDRVRRWCAG